MLASGSCLVVEKSQPTPPTTAATAISTPLNPAWTPPPNQDGSPVLGDMAEVVARVKPSVVAIDVEVISFDIFNRPITQPGAGSGWILDANGLIVTNNHVVEGAENISVTLDDGRIFAAESVSTDPQSDLAVIKVNATDLPAVTVGDSSEVKVGELVAAIGNALGRGISMKGGWVSRLGVSLPDESGQTLYDLIETDAAINPGNSGGPLVNMAGEVVGITSVKLTSVEVEGIGYAISSNSAMPIIEALVKHGYVSRPWLGVVLQTVDQGIAARFNLAVDRGALIVGVAENSPAQVAGLREGDVIVSFDNWDISGTLDLVQAIRESSIGQKVTISYWRDNSQRTTDLTLGESPHPE